MDEVALVAYIMGIIAFVIAALFIVGAIIIYKVAKKNIENNAHVQRVIKNRVRHEVGLYNTVINKINNRRN